jgi:hypothetical protein
MSCVSEVDVVTDYLAVDEQAPPQASVRGR